MAKTPPGNFQVTTSEIPILSQQAVTSKGIPVPYTNLQLNPYHNTQLDLFCSNNFPFRCTAPKYVTNQCADSSMRLESLTREGCWQQSSSVHSIDEDQEDAQSQNPTMHIHRNFFVRMMNQGKTLSSVTNYLNKLCSTLVQLAYTLTALKIILLYVQSQKKRRPKHIIMDQSQNRTRILFFKKLDRQLSVEVLSSSYRATGLEQLLKLNGQLAVELTVEI